MKIFSITFLVPLAFFLSCKGKEGKEAMGLNIDTFQSFEVDSLMNKNMFFGFMDKRFEPASYEDRVTGADSIKNKSTSDVVIFDVDHRKERIPWLWELWCRAHFEYDTQIIKISSPPNDTGYSGIIIRVKQDKFNVQPFQMSHFPYGTSEVTTKIEKQKLVLNKAYYQPGDSIYGYVYIRTINSDSVRQYGSGYFRAKIGKE